MQVAQKTGTRICRQSHGPYWGTSPESDISYLQQSGMYYCTKGKRQLKALLQTIFLKFVAINFEVL